jgi:hypothetical protein
MPWVHLPKREYHFHTTCISSDAKSIHDMTDHAREVTLATFRRHCETREWERSLGYAIGPERDLHLKDDWHVSYWRSRYRGHACYYAVHSAIEHIFIVGERP